MFLSKFFYSLLSDEININRPITIDIIKPIKSILNFLLSHNLLIFNFLLFILIISVELFISTF